MSILLETSNCLACVEHLIFEKLDLLQPPLLIGALAKNSDTQRELINYAMICSGIFTLVHVSPLPLPSNTWH